MYRFNSESLQDIEKEYSRMMAEPVTTRIEEIRMVETPMFRQAT
jgi:hypothetical protein